MLEEHRRAARIIVAEDDREMRRIVADALRKDGHQVIEAADGTRLLCELSHDDGPGVDLVVSDIRMPQKSGLEVLSVLRDRKWTVPVILMTAFGDEDVRERAQSLGATLFDKPFNVADLRRTVLQVLGR